MDIERSRDWLGLGAWRAQCFFTAGRLNPLPLGAWSPSWVERNNIPSLRTRCKGGVVINVNRLFARFPGFSVAYICLFWLRFSSVFVCTVPLFSCCRWTSMYVCVWGCVYKECIFQWCTLQLSLPGCVNMIYFGCCNHKVSVPSGYAMITATLDGYIHGEAEVPPWSITRHSRASLFRASSFSL